MSLDLPFFIFSTPRSGSTLLMRILADTPRICCRGETDGLLWALKDLHGRRGTLWKNTPEAFQSLEEQAATGHFPSHLNGSTEESWNLMVGHVLRSWINPPEDVFHWGLKDVHTGRHGSGTGFIMWQWLRDTMPRAAFIFLRRDYDKRLLSMTKNPEWWIPSYGSCWGQVETRLQNQDRAFQEAAALFGPDRTVLLDYEDLKDFQTLAAKLAPIGMALDSAAHQRQLAIKL